MLNRVKLLSQFESHASLMFKNFSHELLFAQELWQTIARDDSFTEKVKLLGQNILPHWKDNLASSKHINSVLHDYQIVSVDGSQIYPDRHQGRACYLINIGAVALSYQKSGSCIKRECEPYIMYSDIEDEDESIDHVNCKRSEYELIESFAQSKRMREENKELPFACLVDGSLIFWHLQSKTVQMRSRYLASSLAVLQQFYDYRIPIAGYISLPKSKELIKLIHFAREHNFGSIHHEYALTHIVDADLMAFLGKGTRSTLFEHRSSITEQYPAPLRPWFFYFNTGFEVARIEVPAWLAEDPCLLEQTTALISNQVEKGYGYPVALSEAHETAVVKGADREFFYHMLEKFTRAHKQQYTVSQKSLKKRKMHI